MSQDAELVFFGEILPGFDTAEARARLMGLLKLPADQEEQLFSGDRVVLKSGVSQDEAEQYRRYLQGMGIRIRVEAAAESGEEAASEGRAFTPEQQEGGEGAQPLPAVKQSITPLEEDDASASASEVASALESGYASPVVGWNVRGRMGRGRYVVAFSVWIAVFFLGLGLGGVIGSPVGGVLMGGVFLLTMYQGVRLSVLRCHDCGWSGWMFLITLIPFVGSIFSLVLMFYPPEEGANAYGREDRVPGTGAVIGSILASLVALVMGIAGLVVMFGGASQLQNGLESLEGGARVVVADTTTGKDALAAAYDSSDSLIMFSTADCKPCQARGRLLEEMGIPFHNVSIDQDEDAFSQFMARVEETQGAFVPADAPYFDANGTLLSNPTLEELAEALAR